MTATALRSCQERYDNLLPDDPPTPWLETPSGQEWLEDGISSLILGLNVVIRHSPLVLVQAQDFIVEFSAQASDIYAYDMSHTLDWALARGHSIGWPQYQKLAREVATKMLTKHADVAASQEAP